MGQKQNEFIVGKKTWPCVEVIPEPGISLPVTKGGEDLGSHKEFVTIGFPFFIATAMMVKKHT